MNQNQYYGDNNRWFIGRVIDSRGDPLGLGRVKVRIYGIHPEDDVLVTKEDLPWASVVVPVTEGGVGGFGTNVGIQNQAQVYGIFLDGLASQLPLVLGSIPKFEQPLTGNSPDLSYPQDPSDIKVKEDPTGEIGVNIDDVLPGSTNCEKAFNWLINPNKGLGLKTWQAAGMIGNFWVESDANGSGKDLNPKAVAKGEGSIGIAQWNPAERAGNRAGRLKTFAATILQPKVDYRTMYAQLNYIKYEYHNPEVRNILGDLGLSKLENTSSVFDATKRFMLDFEKPLTTERKIVYDSFGRKVKEYKKINLELAKFSARVSVAEEMHEKFTGQK